MNDRLSPRCARLVVSSDEVAVYAAEIVTVRNAMIRIAMGRAKPRRSRELRAAGIAFTGAEVRQNIRIFMGLSGS